MLYRQISTQPTWLQPDSGSKANKATKQNGKCTRRKVNPINNKVLTFTNQISDFVWKNS